MLNQTCYVVTCDSSPWSAAPEAQVRSSCPQSLLALCHWYQHLVTEQVTLVTGVNLERQLAPVQVLVTVELSSLLCVGVVGEVESMTATAHHLMVRLVESGGWDQVTGWVSGRLWPASICLTCWLGCDHLSICVPPRWTTENNKLNKLNVVS